MLITENQQHDKMCIVINDKSQSSVAPCIRCDGMLTIIYCWAFTERFLPRDSYAKRGICRRRVSVSVTLRYCIKTAKHRITQITPHDNPMTLVFWHQSSLRNSKAITPYGGDKCKWGGLKFVTFDEKRAITRKRYNTIQYNIKTYNAPYVTKMLFVGAEMTRD